MKKKLFSILLVLTLVLTMATSVSAAFYLPTSAEFATTILGTFDFEGYEGTAAPTGWYSGSGNRFKAETFGDGHGTALAFRNWYNEPEMEDRVEGGDYGNSNGKIFYMRPVSGISSKEVLMEFDLYHATGSVYSIGYCDASGSPGKANRKTV